MNRTPFALFTLLCTLASSIVAAGNASRRAGGDPATPMKPVKMVAATVHPVAYLATVETPEPAWNAAAWKPIDVRRAYLALLDHLPKSIEQIPAPKTAPAVIPLKADVQSRVTARVSREALTGGNAVVKTPSKAKNPTPVSPLVGRASWNQADWTWQRSMTIAGNFTSLGGVSGTSKSAAKSLRIGTAVARPGVEPHELKSFAPGAYWTPALHVTESGRDLLAVIDVAPTSSTIVKRPVAKAGLIANWSAVLEQCLQQLPNARAAATARLTEEFASLAFRAWRPIKGERPSSISAQRPVGTQK